jgi:ligand-binding sensor domain-containing protein
LTVESIGLVKSTTIELGSALLAQVHVRGLTELSANRFMVAGFDGVFDLDITSGQFKHYQHLSGDVQSLSDNAINAAVKVSDSEVWLASGLGLDSLNVHSGQITRLLDNPDLAEFIGSRRINDIYLHGDKVLVAANSGIFRLQLVTQQAGETSPRVKRLGSIAELKNAWSLKFKPNGDKLIGTYGLGLFEVKANGKVKRYTYGKEGNESLLSNNVSALTVDKQQRLWVGTNKGLNWRQKDQPGFATLLPSKLAGVEGIDNIRDIHQDRHGHLWFLSTRGLIEVDGQLNLQRLMTAQTTPALQFDQWANVLLFVDNLLLIGSDSGLQVIDLEQNRQLQFFPINGVVQMLEDKAGSWWILSFDTLYRFEPNTMTLEPMANNRLFSASQLAKGSGYYNFIEDSFAQLWLAWPGGVKVFDTLNHL